ncbi:putative U11/U12 small nuclear ribonucleoprotein 25 kDa protein [Cocos nucifera]|uniref:Putative U11/U12 small nuclear ribonucleoprotein 25 kDa protein n=1 Tax=Cocos nucifera TaxID=13894 RepID=A0A8K0ILV6_COCNU|nr:putative U11/U12 small nuclear ribonucleoprotein 25 kDa protein [Cocos nucifera]
MDSGSRNEDVVGYNTTTAKKAVLQPMLSALLDDPILSDVPKKPSLADVDTLINLELGSAMKISVVKMDNTSFDVAVLNSATLKDLKLAIGKKINEIEQAQMGHRHISWRHIWANFCLVHHNEKLIDDNSLLRDYGLHSLINGKMMIFGTLFISYRKSFLQDRRLMEPWLWTLPLPELEASETPYSKFSKRNSRIHEMERQFGELVANWNPPSLLLEHSDIGDQDWFFWVFKVTLQSLTPTGAKPAQKACGVMEAVFLNTGGEAGIGSNFFFLVYFLKGAVESNLFLGFHMNDLKFIQWLILFQDPIHQFSVNPTDVAFVRADLSCLPVVTIIFE